MQDLNPMALVLFVFGLCVGGVFGDAWAGGLAASLVILIGTVYEEWRL